MFNGEHELAAFVAVQDHPNIGVFQHCNWQGWLRRYYRLLNGLNSNSTTYTLTLLFLTQLPYDITLCTFINVLFSFWIDQVIGYGMGVQKENSVGFSVVTECRNCQVVFIALLCSYSQINKIRQTSGRSYKNQHLVQQMAVLLMIGEGGEAALVRRYMYIQDIFLKPGNYLISIKTRI